MYLLEVVPGIADAVVEQQDALVAQADALEVVVGVALVGDTEADGALPARERALHEQRRETGAAQHRFAGGRVDLVGEAGRGATHGRRGDADRNALGQLVDQCGGARTDGRELGRAQLARGEAVHDERADQLACRRRAGGRLCPSRTAERERHQAGRRESPGGQKGLRPLYAMHRLGLLPRTCEFCTSRPGESMRRPDRDGRPSRKNGPRRVGTGGPFVAIPGGIGRPAPGVRT